MVGVRRIALTLVALAVVVVAACSSDNKPATVTSTSSPAPSAAAPSSTTTSTSIPEDIYLECGDAPATEVQSVTADFDGDGVDDRIVDVVCDTSGEGAPHLVVAFVGSSRQVLVDVCRPGTTTCP